MQKRVVITKGGLSHYASSTAEMMLNTGDEFPYSGIWIYSGQQGSGKTLLMMHTLKTIFTECPKALIVSDISIYGIPSIPFSGVEDFDKYENGQHGIIFVLDEIQTLWSSLQSKNMPESQLTIWSQNRKNKRLILGTSQRYTRIAKGLREQTSYHFECRKPIFPTIFPYTIKNGADYDDEGNYIGEKPASFWFVPKVDVMRMYNTLEVVRKERYNTNG